MKFNPQRPLNSSIDPRNGAPKRTAEAQPVPGMRSRIAPSHEFLHGAPVDDEPLQKSSGRETPIHSATPSRVDRGQHIPGEASRVLDEAARLGRPKEIDDAQNGRALDGGTRPVTSQD
jgi:hypothetical protein